MPWEQESPWAAAGAAALGVQQAQQKKAQDAEDAADRKAQREAQAQAIAFQREKFDYDKQRDAVSDKRADDAATLAAKREADEAIHNANLDAIKKAQERRAQTRDDRQYKLDLKRIEQAHEEAVANRKNATTVAQIHAAGAIGAARIHASATLGAASMREQGENARFQQGQQTTIRGQNLGAYERGIDPFKPVPKPASGGANKPDSAEAAIVKANPNYKDLALNDQVDVEDGIRHFGYAAFVNSLQAIAAKKIKAPSGMSAERAQGILKTLELEAP